MNSEPRHRQTPGLGPAPTTEPDPEISPSAIPPVPPPPAVPPDAGVAELRSLLISFSSDIYKVIQGIPAAIRSLDSRTGLLRRIGWAIAVVLVFDIAFTLLVGYDTKATADTQKQINAVVAKLDHVVHNDCYFYGLIITNYHQENNPTRQAYSGGPAAFDQAYIGMQQAADYIDCGIKHKVPGT